jgi:hypothetical protein
VRRRKLRERRHPLGVPDLGADTVRATEAADAEGSGWYPGGDLRTRLSVLLRIKIRCAGLLPEDVEEMVFFHPS